MIYRPESERNDWRIRCNHDLYAQTDGTLAGSCTVIHLLSLLLCNIHYKTLKKFSLKIIESPNSETQSPPVTVLRFPPSFLWVPTFKLYHWKSYPNEFLSVRTFYCTCSLRFPSKQRKDNNYKRIRIQIDSFALQIVNRFTERTIRLNGIHYTYNVYNIMTYMCVV